VLFMADDSPVQTTVDREKTAPFLIRAFVKINGFHRLNLFEDGTLPTTDEHQLFTWRDATLPELLTTLRITSGTAEFRHPLARFSLRALYADSGNKGHFAQKELGQVSSREILEETLYSTDRGENRQHGRTLEELRFVPGDYLSIAAHLPKTVTLGSGPASGISIKGSAVGADTNGKWARGAGRGESGWGTQGPSGGVGRGGGHWRARPGVAAPGGRGGGDADDRSWRRDREPPAPRARRDSPPRTRPPIPERDRDLDRRSVRRSRSRSRSRSPRRRGSRYD